MEERRLWQDVIWPKLKAYLQVAAPLSWGLKICGFSTYLYYAFRGVPLIGRALLLLIVVAPVTVVGLALIIMGVVALLAAQGITKAAVSTDRWMKAQYARVVEWVRSKINKKENGKHTMGSNSQEV